MAQHDYNIANATFPATRTDINSVLSAINTSNSGTSRPSSAVEGTVWLDTTNATTPTLKFYDGSDDISLATLDYTANTVNWIDSTVVFDIVNDLSPQLGGNLDLNSNDITGTGDINITGSVTATSFSGDGSALTGIESGITWQSSIKTSSFTAVANEGYWIDTSSNTVTITFPSSASVGDTIELVDYARTWGTNKIIIDSNGLNYQGDPDTANVEYDTSGQALRVVYSGATKGWIPTSDEVSEDNPVTPPVTADFLVIAGGASGGNGGGGAGGYRNSYNSETSGGGGSSESSLSLIQGTQYTITVGAGGSAGTINSSTSQGGSAGSNSSLSGSNITDIISTGGGRGATSSTITSDINGGAGGSGGGAGQQRNSPYSEGTGGAGTSNQGFNGGNAGNWGGANFEACGGGGGAGAVGANESTVVGGAGGNGLSSSITGSSVTRAGGGGGGGFAGQGGAGGGAGGSGGGGAGTITSNGGNATVNTGSGGGGGSSAGSSYTVTTGAGGSGIVILRLATASYSGTTTGSPTVTTSGSDTILTYTGSGSYTA